MNANPLINLTFNSRPFSKCSTFYKQKARKTNHEIVMALTVFGLFFVVVDKHVQLKLKECQNRFSIHNFESKYFCFFSCRFRFCFFIYNMLFKMENRFNKSNLISKSLMHFSIGFFLLFEHFADFFFRLPWI